MVYKVIGLMSGSSLDGLDIAHVQLEEVRGQWSYQLLHTACKPYNDEWLSLLQQAANLSVSAFLKLNTRYGRYLGEQINDFIAENAIQHQVHFIVSHGHTVFHEPGSQTTFQLGDGASIAAVSGLPVISDLRALDVALGGQGAPIVPIGDKLLFGNYDYLLNLGGIANMTVYENGCPIAYDICPANQVLNRLAEREGLAMDEGGAIAATGGLLLDVLDGLEANSYYKLPSPKSLSNEDAIGMAFPALSESSHSTADLLHTVTVHIARQIAAEVAKAPHNKGEAALLVTGGGAFNTYLITLLTGLLAPLGVKVVVPDDALVKYKEALVMALIGTLRWREEANVLSSVTGASKDSCGGALWMA